MSLSARFPSVQPSCTTLLQLPVPSCSPVMGTAWSCPLTEMPGGKIWSFGRLLKKHQRTREIPNSFSTKSAPLKPPGVSNSLEPGYTHEWRCRWWDGNNSVSRLEPRGATLGSSWYRDISATLLRQLVEAEGSHPCNLLPCLEYQGPEDKVQNPAPPPRGARLLPLAAAGPVRGGFSA